MEDMVQVHRGDMYYANAPGCLGSEQWGKRPCIVVSNDIGNKYSDIVEVVYLTTAKKKPLPTHTKILSTGRRSIALCEQVSCISKGRLEKYIGKVTEEEMRRVERAIKISLGISEEANKVNELRIFDNEEFGQVRTVDIDGKPYFVGIDIARALGYSDCPKAIRTHCKGVAEVSTPTNGGNQIVKVIPEGDIYRLVVRSQLPAAERFENWVFDEVLPSIRQTGIYAELSPELKAIFAHDKKLRHVVTHMEEHEKRIDNLESNMTVDYGQQKTLNDKHHCRAIEVLGGKISSAYKDANIKDKVFRTIWRDYKDYFGVASYRDTPAARYTEAEEYLNNWIPDTNLKLEIQGKNREIA